MRDELGREVADTECPFCGAHPNDPCRNVRAGVGEVGSGAYTVGTPGRHRWIKRIHPERRGLTRNGDVWITRRYHPDGSPLYDVNVRGPRVIGVVRQHPGQRGWFAYSMTSAAPTGESLPRRSDAVDFLVEQHAALIASR